MCGRKKGNRDFRAYFVCTCPGARHVPVPEDWEYGLDANGNPRTPITFTTECPLNCREIKMRCSPDRAKWRLFTKWTKTTRAYVSNHGNPANLAREWLKVQGCGPPDELGDYCHNAGRIAFAGICDELHTPYHESFQITGDLWDVWKGYQPSLLASNFAEREQSTVPRIACAALRRFRQSMGRGKLPGNLNVGLSLQEKLMVGFMTTQGQSDLAKSIVEGHRQQHAPQHGYYPQ